MSERKKALWFALLAFLLVGWWVSCFSGNDGDDDDNQVVDDTGNSDDSAIDDSETDDTGADTDDDVSDDDVTDDDATDDDTSLQQVWEDPDTSLLWQNGSDCCHNWEGAKQYCQNLSWGGYSNWRLPSISELRSLVRGCEATETGGSCNVTDSCLRWYDCKNDPCGGCAESGGPGTDGLYWPAELVGECCWYWSSSFVEQSDDYGWAIQFTYGSIDGDWIEAGNNVRCVI
jgi:hypothetical protein